MIKKLQDKEVRKAVYLGVICMFSYLACYYARNILSAISPKMLESSIYTVEMIGTMSSVGMLTYAGGQLVNGYLGDKIKAKFMVSGGLFFAGICNFLIPLSQSQLLTVIAYSVSSFFLSMIFAPITRVVAENTLPHYASRCCLGFTFASFLGNPAAGIAAMLFDWEAAFFVSGVILLAMGSACYVVFAMCERKGYIQYRIAEKKKSKSGKLKVLLENSIVQFVFVSALTGIIRTSVVFWVPTYANQHLGFSATDAAAIFTVVTLIKSFSPYINNLLIYEQVLKRNMKKSLVLFFTLSAVFFGLMYVVKNPIVNVVCLLLALFTSAGASTMMFSVYCPSLGHTGMVSGVTGFLDSVSYAAAASANQLFAKWIESMGWNNLILIWTGLMAAGILVVALKKRKKV